MMIKESECIKISIEYSDYFLAILYKKIVENIISIRKQHCQILLYSVRVANLK